MFFVIIPRPALLDLFDTVRQGIIVEIRDVEDPLGCVESVKCQYLKPGLVTDMNCCEEGGGQDECSHVFQPLIGHNPDVFQVVALLDEPNRVLHPPAGQIPLHYPPEKPYGDAAWARW